MAPSLLHLPNELLETVCSYADPSSLLQLRRVSVRVKACSRTSMLERNFSILQVTLRRPQSLRRASKITHHHEFRTRLHTIIIYLGGPMIDNRQRRNAAGRKIGWDRPQLLERQLQLRRYIVNGPAIHYMFAGLYGSKQRLKLVFDSRMNPSTAGECMGNCVAWWSHEDDFAATMQSLSSCRLRLDSLTTRHSSSVPMAYFARDATARLRYTDTNTLRELALTVALGPGLPRATGLLGFLQSLSSTLEVLTLTVTDPANLSPIDQERRSAVFQQVLQLCRFRALRRADFSGHPATFIACDVSLLTFLVQHRHILQCLELWLAHPLCESSKTRQAEVGYVAQLCETSTKSAPQRIRVMRVGLSSP